MPEKRITTSTTNLDPPPVDKEDMATSRQPPIQPQPESDPVQMDRRRSSREPVVTVGMIRPLNHDDAAPEQVLVTNVSLHGVGVRATRPIGVGTRWAIEIGVGPLHITSRMRVVRTRLRSDGTYDIGAEFC
jgi:hypothetical protein